MPGPVTYDVAKQAYVQDGVIVGYGMGGTLPGAQVAADPWQWQPFGGTDYLKNLSIGDPLLEKAKTVIGFDAGPAPGAGGGLPAGTAGALAAVGVAPAVIGLGSLIYGGLQLAGLQFPWETGPGEGFIAPWTRPQVRDEQGMWVTAETRPDLFNGAGPAGGPFPGMAAGALGGVMVRKIWTNASRDGKIPATVQSVMLTNGIVITRSLVTGEIKKHRPKKHIVISSDPRLSSIKKLDRVQKKISKLVTKYAPKKKSVQAPSAYLSAAERKMLSAGKI